MVEINNITVKYRSGGHKIPALNSFGLKIDKGDYISVLGPNGSGKSTLVRAICGLVPLSGGAVFIDGEKVVYGSFGEKLFGKAAVVFQEPSGQFLMPTVKKEICAVLQNLGLAPQDQNRRLYKITEQFSLGDILDNSPEHLSAGQMQLVNLASALAVSPDLLIMDEPTTYLDSQYREMLIDKVCKLHKSGLTIIHVTQYPDEALRSRKICILDSGKLVAAGDPKTVLSDMNILERNRLSMPRELACRKFLGIDIHNEESVDKLINSLKGENGNVSMKRSVAENEKLLAMEALSFTYRPGSFTAEINRLELYSGQIAGLVGTTGSGKSTIALLLAGVLSPDTGRITYRGKEITQFTSREFRKLIGLSWQMPEPVLIGPTVEDDLRLLYKGRGADETDLRKTLVEIGLPGFENRIVDTLSGGEKRKLSLASAITLNPEYLILDEPAAFLDPVAQLELLDVIRNEVERGCGALIIGHDLSFLSRICDRMIGLKDGGMVFDVRSETFFSDPEYCLWLGIGIDPIIAFKSRLVKSGLLQPSVSLDPEDIASDLNNFAAPETDFS